VVARRSSPTAPEQGFDDAFARIERMLRECAAEAGATPAGIGVGSTGPVNPMRGTIEDADLLPGWQGAPLVPRLEEAFQVRGAMENDCDAVALAEAAWGFGAGKRRFFYVTISTGIGTGLIVDGQVYRGVDGSHPELGHMVIDDSGPACYCGSRGCWEALASGTAMAAWMETQAPGRWTAAEICRRAQAGDDLARKAVDREAYYLGLGLANMIIAFCPDGIALGGGVMNSAHLLWEGARAIIRRNCKLVPYERTAIACAALGADAPLAGAARVWSHRFESHAG
jgi:glucokinase